MGSTVIKVYRPTQGDVEILRLWVGDNKRVLVLSDCTFVDLDNGDVSKFRQLLKMLNLKGTRK